MAVQYDLYSLILSKGKMGGYSNSLVLGKREANDIITLGPNTSSRYSILSANFDVILKKPSGNSAMLIKACLTSVLMFSSTPDSNYINLSII